jgi:hypothetical protein
MDGPQDMIRVTLYHSDNLPVEHVRIPAAGINSRGQGLHHILQQRLKPRPRQPAQHIKGTRHLERRIEHAE